MQPITLSDDPRERVDQILLAIGTISMEFSGFEAVYLITAIQTVLSTPGYVDRMSIAGLRLKQIAEKLQPHVYREPLIKDLIDNGWNAVEIARQAYDEIKAEAAAEVEPLNDEPVVEPEMVATNDVPTIEVKPVLPKDMHKLKKIAKVANVKSFANLKKTALISALKSLPSDKLIAAIEQAN